MIATVERMSKLENRNERAAVRLEHVIGQKVRAVREKHNLTQDELAERLRIDGLDWSRSAVAALEGGTKSLSVVEIAILALSLSDLDPKLTFTSLVTSDQPIPIGTSVQAPGNMVAAIISGRFRRKSLEAVGARAKSAAWAGREEILINPDPTIFDEVQAERDAKGDAELKAARRLDVSAYHVALAALRLWGHSLTVERDKRVAAKAEGDTRALRGHVTRQLMNELTPILRVVRK
jgi:transcriptional regulator with XRE-family HTH domain